MSGSSPSPATLARVAQVAGPRATVENVRPLAGGMHASTHLIRTGNPRREMVLRQFPAGDDAAERETRVLTALDGLDGLVPRLLASDVDGTWAGCPSVLISRLPGRAHITPRDPRDWAARLGRALARIHGAAMKRLAGLPRVFDRRGGSLAAVTGPAGGVVAAGWERIANAARVLTHYDFHSGNVVWQHGRLTGVIDWSGGAVGPPGYDLGWCRLDLYLLYGNDVADVFLDAYETVTRSAVPDKSLWDLWALARSYDEVETWAQIYREVGRGDLTATELRVRHTAWTDQLLTEPTTEGTG